MSKDAAYIKSSLSTDNCEPFMVSAKQSQWSPLVNHWEFNWRTHLFWFIALQTNDVWLSVSWWQDISHYLRCSIDWDLWRRHCWRERGRYYFFWYKGVKSTWTIHSPFKKFFVISNC